MHLRIRALARCALVVGLTACKRPTTIRQELQLPAGAWTGVAAEPLEVRGPTSELCVVLPNIKRASLVSGGVDVGGGRQVALQARLRTAVGIDVPMSGPSVVVGGEVKVCFARMRDSVGQLFRGAEVQASDTITVQRVEWWSGTRRGFP